MKTNADDVRETVVGKVNVTYNIGAVERMQDEAIKAQRGRAARAAAAPIETSTQSQPQPWNLLEGKHFKKT